MKIFEYLFFGVFGYVLGSILCSYFLLKFFCKKNVFKISKDQNPGTANAFMHGNFFCGVATLIFDLGKGFLPVFLAKNLLDSDNILFALIMVAPVLGHCYPIWHSFNGGKGIAVSFGVALGLAPQDYLPILLLCFFYIIFSLVIRITPHKNRSIFTYLFFGVVCSVTEPLRATSLGIALISAVIVFRHIEKYNEIAELTEVSQPQQEVLTKQKIYK